MADNYSYQSIDDFSGGLKTYPPPYKLGTSAFRELNNLLITPHDSLELREGQANFFTTLSGEEVRALARATVSGGVERLVYGTHKPLSTIGNVYAYNENTNLSSFISDYTIKEGSRFVLFDQKVIWLADIDLSTSQVLVWDGNDDRILGTPAPTTAPVISIFSPSSGSDAITAIASDPVYYWVTFYDPATGIESNPTTIGGIFTPSNSLYQGSLSDPFRVDIASIPTSTGLWRRLYRQGGGLPEGRLVATISDDSTTDWEDNLSNLYAKDREGLSFSKDAPPSTLDDTLVYALSHKRRLLLFSKSTVYVSSLNEPWYFPQIVTFRETDGDRLPIDGDFQNPIRAACPIGGGVYIARAKDCWMLSGEDTDTFILGGVCTIGCIAPLSLVACGDVPVWLAPDRQVWAMTGTGPKKISEDIQDILKAVSLEDAATACAAYHRNTYILSFPDANSGAGLFLVYDFDTSTWTDWTRSYSIARYLYTDTGASDGDEIIIATTDDFTNIGGGSYVGVVRLLTDDVSNLDLFLKSGDLLFDLPHDDKKIANIRLLGTLDKPNGQEVTLTITAIKERKDGTSTTKTASFNLRENTEGVLLDTDVPAGIVGQRIWYSISGVANIFKLDMIEIGYSLVGDRRA